MERHCGVEIGLGGTHFQADCQQLSHFARRMAENVDSQYFVVRRVDQDLHCRTLGAAGQGRLHRPEIRRVNVDNGVASQRLFLAHPDRAQLGRRENSGGNIGVIHLDRFAAEDCFGKSLAFPNGDRVRLTRFVTSPTAWIESTLVRE